MAMPAPVPRWTGDHWPLRAASGRPCSSIAGYWELRLPTWGRPEGARPGPRQALPREDGDVGRYHVLDLLVPTDVLPLSAEPPPAFRWQDDSEGTER